MDSFENNFAYIAQHYSIWNENISWNREGNIYGNWISWFWVPIRNECFAWAYYLPISFESLIKYSAGLEL